jgi:DDE_Tnp_1-associated/Transposase DDE domain
MSPLTLVEVLADVPDPRSRHGRIHPLPAVLALVVLGLLLGRTSLAGIARLGRLYGAPLAHALGFRRGKTPTKAMLSELLRALDADAFEAALSRWVRSRLGRSEPAHLSLDGKTLRGSRDGAVPGQHLVAVYAPQVEAVLAQVRVDAKTNEHKAALRLLGLLPLAGKVVVGDALFCQRDLAEQVVTAGGHYVLVAKENQPGLQADVAAGFGYEAGQRAIAAAFSPRGPAAGGRTPGDHPRQGPWPGREAHLADDDPAHGPRALGGAGARV